MIKSPQNMQNNNNTWVLYFSETRDQISLSIIFQGLHLGESAMKIFCKKNEASYEWPAVSYDFLLLKQWSFPAATIVSLNTSQNTLTNTLTFPKGFRTPFAFQLPGFLKNKIK